MWVSPEFRRVAASVTFSPSIRTAPSAIFRRASEPLAARPAAVSTALRFSAPSGAATVVFAVSHRLWLSLLALAIMGAADAVSVLIRSALVQLATPDEMRGRVGAVNFLFINASSQLGEFESGLTAAWLGAVPAAVVGGLGTIVVALLWMQWFPQLRKVERLE